MNEDCEPIVRNQVMAWEDIRSSDFPAFPAEPRYLQLVRGH